MSLDNTLMLEVAALYEQTGVIMNWFPFRIGNEVRWRIYTTDMRNWNIDNPLVDGAYLHYASLEDAIEATLTRVRDRNEKPGATKGSEDLQ